MSTSNNYYQQNPPSPFILAMRNFPTGPECVIAAPTGPHCPSLYPQETDYCARLRRDPCDGFTGLSPAADERTTNPPNPGQKTDMNWQKPEGPDRNEDPKARP